MENGSRISMDWSNLQFKAKDLIMFFGYVITAVFFISRMTNAVERQGEKITELQIQITEMKNEDKGNSKDFQVFIQSIQNQVNATNTQVRLLEQRVDILERNSR